MAWLLNDSSPVPLATEFEAAPAASTEVYWGGPVSMSFEPAGEGTVHNVAVNESVGTTDGAMVSAAFASALTESVAAADSLAVIASFVSAITESVGATDTQVGVASVLSATNESASASDSQAGSAAFLVAVSESVAAGDAQTGGLLLAVDVLESFGAADAQDAGLAHTAELSESITALDSTSADVTSTPPTPTPTPTPEQPGAGSGFIFGDGFDFFEGPRTKSKRKPARTLYEGEPVEETKCPQAMPEAPTMHTGRSYRDEVEPEPVLTPSMLDALAEPIIVLRPSAPIAEARRPVERFPETSTEVHAISPATQPLYRAAIARAKAEAEAQRIAREAQLESEDIEAITAMLLAMDL